MLSAKLAVTGYFFLTGDITPAFTHLVLLMVAFVKADHSATNCRGHCCDLPSIRLQSLIEITP